MPAIPRRLIARFYRDEDGIEPVLLFLEHIPTAHRLAISRQIERLNYLDEAAPHLAYPYSSQIEGELRELRCHYGNTHYRILYRRSQQFVILLHIFAKSTRKVLGSDKQIARDRWNDFHARMNAVPRETPSPVGKRAPSLRP